LFIVTNAVIMTPALCENDNLFLFNIDDCIFQKFIINNAIVVYKRAATNCSAQLNFKFYLTTSNE